MAETSQLLRFSRWYETYHGYVSLCVCVVGVVCNGFNVVVLTRRDMMNPTSYLLTALAVSDLLTMLSCIPFSVQFHILYGSHPSPDRNNFPWILFQLFHVNFSLTTHTVSIWLGVVISGFRYSYVRSSADSTGSATLLRRQMRRVRFALFAVCVCTVLVLLPNYYCVRISDMFDPSSNRTMYEVSTVNVTSSGRDLVLAEVMTLANFWIHALVIKILPCGLMSIFGFLLIQTMTVSVRKMADLHSSTSGSQKSRRTRNHHRTTAMLVAVIVLCLLTELPQGILALCSGLREEFFIEYYVPLGDTMDVVALVNNGINFTLYCAMSTKFRLTFFSLFCPCFCPAKPPKH